MKNLTVKSVTDRDVVISMDFTHRTDIYQFLSSKDLEKIEKDLGLTSDDRREWSDRPTSMEDFAGGPWNLEIVYRKKKTA